MQPDEVLATVNGVAIHRGDLVAALDERARQSYVEAADDLRDLEHSAVRDYLGRQSIERQAKETLAAVIDACRLAAGRSSS